MDIKREGVAKKKMIRRVIYLVLTVAVVTAAGWQINKLKPAAPSVECQWLLSTVQEQRAPPVERWMRQYFQDTTPLLRASKLLLSSCPILVLRVG